MIALLLAFVLVQGEPPAASTRCHFTGACAVDGWCDDYRRMCATRSQSACAASYACVAHGDCRWVEGTSTCMGDDPSACGPEGAPCRLYGNCKAGKPGPFLCGATRQGCAQSQDCKVNGNCGLGRSEVGSAVCVPTQAGCKGSRGCIERGDCKLAGQRCAHDASACAASTRCRDHGACSSNGGICSHLSSADCASSRSCSVYGRCGLRIQSCDPRDLECAPYQCVVESGCAQSEVCKRYGACNEVASRCRVQPEAPPTCTTRSVRVAKVEVSAQERGAGADLVDGRYDSGWSPGASPLPHQVTLRLAQRERVVGLAVAAGMHRIDRVEGVMAHAFGTPRGIAVMVGGRVHEVVELRSRYEKQRVTFAPVETDVVVLEVFDADMRAHSAAYAVTEVEVLACE